MIGSMQIVPLPASSAQCCGDSCRRRIMSCTQRGGRFAGLNNSDELFIHWDKHFTSTHTQPCPRGASINVQNKKKGQNYQNRKPRRTSKNLNSHPCHLYCQRTIAAQALCKLSGNLLLLLLPIESICRCRPRLFLWDMNSILSNEGQIYRSIGIRPGFSFL